MSYVGANARLLKSAHPRTGCAVADASAAGSRDCHAAASAECASQADSEASPDAGRPAALRVAVPAVSVAEECHHHRSAGDGATLAPLGLSAVPSLLGRVGVKRFQIRPSAWQ